MPGAAPARNRRNTGVDHPLDPIMTTAPRSAAMAYFDGLLATDLIETADLTLDPEVLNRGGWWAVMITFEGAMTGYRVPHGDQDFAPAAHDYLDRADPRQLAQFAERADYQAGVRRIPPAHRGR
jgi:para-aminobenzoate synthetase component 1